MRRTIAWVITAMMFVACAGSDASDAPPTAAGLASPIGTSRRSEPPRSEGPSSAPTPVTVPELTIRWRADHPGGLGNVESLVGVARAGDVFVLVAELPFRDDGSPEMAAWWSTDGKDWTLAQEFPFGERILTLTAGGPGFVVGGFGGDHAAVWTSVDGRAWTSVSDSSLSNGTIAQLLPTASGVVGFGWHADDSAGIWTSSDGAQWLAATNPTGLEVARGLQAVGTYEGRAVAIVRQSENGPQEVWETTGRAEWTKVGSLPTRLTVERIAGGARGWVAIGSNQAWTSTDGRRWSKGVPGPDVFADVIVDDSGFVAVGFVGPAPGDTCGDQRPFAGHTWTSADGRFWRLMPVAKEFKAAMVMRLLAVDRTLLGFGFRVDAPAGTMSVGRWAAALPEVSRSAAGSDKASVPEFCGG